jgi:hypothetical protein
MEKRGKFVSKRFCEPEKQNLMANNPDFTSGGEWEKGRVAVVMTVRRMANEGIRKLYTTHP